MTLKSAWVLLSIVAFPSFAFDCPKEIDVDPKHTLLTIPKGWKSFVHPDRYGFKLESVQIYLGPPKNLAQQKLEMEGPSRTVWRRVPGDKADYWMVCSYTDTSINLMKKLSAEINQCTILFEPGITISGLPNVKTVECAQTSQ